MLYTFDDAKARDRHTTQYFELFGTRAIYHDGWWAGTRHGQDGVNMAPVTPFDEDVWELYDMSNDSATVPTWRPSTLRSSRNCR